MNQTWENGKKRNFGPNVGLFGPIRPPQPFFCEGLTKKNTLVSGNTGENEN